MILEYANMNNASLLTGLGKQFQSFACLFLAENPAKSMHQSNKITQFIIPLLIAFLGSSQLFDCYF
jgi:hypothetical protein